MSKHQTCPRCHGDFVGPDTHVGENICTSCTIEEGNKYYDQVQQLQAENERLKQAINQLLTAIPIEIEAHIGQSQVVHDHCAIMVNAICEANQALKEVQK